MTFAALSPRVPFVGRVVLAAVVGLLAGCSSEPGTNPDPVDFSVKVTSKGTPVTGLNLALQPTGPGLPTGVPLVDGSGQGKAIAGSYAYFLVAPPDKDKAKADASKAALMEISEKYWTANMEHQITVSAGATVEVSLD
jgi:hypothetical protein